jgi:hypothetical protein
MTTASRAPRLALLAVAVLVPLGVACKKQNVTTADSCSALIDGAGKAVEKAHVAASSSERCEDDADCAESPTARCTTGCGGYAVHKRATRSFEAAVKMVDDGACKRWDDEGCATIAPRSVPSCPSYVPRCKDHACEMVDRRSP